jgi:hypothetical protein
MLQPGHPRANRKTAGRKLAGLDNQRVNLGILDNESVIIFGGQRMQRCITRPITIAADIAAQDSARLLDNTEIASPFVSPTARNRLIKRPTASPNWR